MVRWLVLAGMVACGGELSVNPESIEWGDIDFNVPTPADGHEVREVTVQNTGSGELEVVLLDLETERLTLGGQLTDVDPPRMVLGAGDLAVLTFGVSGYEPGETENTVRGELVFASSRLRDEVIVPWSYVPQRDAPDGR